MSKRHRHHHHRFSHRYAKHLAHRSPRPTGELIFPLEEPMNETQPIKYELDIKHHSEIQTLILKTAAEIKRNHNVGKGRAQIMAEDYVAANHILGDITGAQLASWLGNIHNGFRKPRREEVFSPPNPAVAEPVQEHLVKEVSTPLTDSDTFNIKLTGRGKRIDPVLAQLIEKCRRIKPGEVWSFPVASEDEARELASFMSKVSQALGWRNGRKAHTYLYQIYPDRLKLKRLI